MTELRNDEMIAGFDCGSKSPLLSSVSNRRADAFVAFASKGVFVALGADSGGVVDQSRMTSERCAVVGETRLEARLRVAQTSLTLDLVWELSGPTLSLRAVVTNEGADEIFVRDLALFDAETDADVGGWREEGRPSSSELAPREVIADQRVDARPIFLDDHTFCGIDWPVADNATDGRAIRCRQFPGERLGPGQSFTARSFSLGVGERGRPAETFLAHLDRLRDRPTGRAAFYFDWLTHGSEGPTESEMEAQFDLLERLRDEFGVQFDIYAVDDGAVETRWGMMFDSYRLEHDRRFPRGMKRLTDRARGLGMDFGVWIGPDGFGESPEEERQRIDTIVRMIEDWNVRLFKMDTCVSSPMTQDPYHNERYMRKLERLAAACRSARPDLIIINHRVTSSPYILGILDSTLWQGAESYVDHFLTSVDRPRLFTRHAAYARGNPTYGGAYSPLLEDHGVCFNGDFHGWADELAAGVFGRALALSPEVYGALFMLPDTAYAELGRLTRLAEEKRELLAHMTLDEETGGFIHSDGRSAIVCVFNDSWETTTETFTIGERLGLNQSSEAFEVTRLFPSIDNEADTWRAAWGDPIKIQLRPFATCAIEVRPVDDATDDVLSGPIATLSSETMDRASISLGEFERETPTPETCAFAERTRFTLDSDPIEAQALDRLPPSRFEEVNACRDFIRAKLRRESITVAAHGWDDDPTTGWSDVMLWEGTSNVWRLDLGRTQPVDRIVVTLSDRNPGPLLGAADGRALDGPIRFEVSADASLWHETEAVVYYIRTPWAPKTPKRVIAEFPESIGPVRYARMDMRGIVVEDIRVTERRGSQRVESPRDGWRGSNLFTTREPLIVFSNIFDLDEAWPGRYLAIVAEFPDDASAPLKQETAVAWIESDDGAFTPIVEACPLTPFHGWECNPRRKAKALTFRASLGKGWEGRRLTARLAWFGAEALKENDAPTPEPRVSGRLVAVSPEPLV